MVRRAAITRNGAASIFYSEGELMWLLADSIIRQKTNDKSSLDTFARDFFGEQNTGPVTISYNRADVIAGLNKIVPYDWAGFFHTWVDDIAVHPPAGFENDGWKLVYNDKPSHDVRKSNFAYSLGLLSRDGMVMDVHFGSPAWKAGLGLDWKIVAVNGRAYSDDLLYDALRTAQQSHRPIELLVEKDDLYRTISIPYFDGPRYPHLERVTGAPDRLTQIVSSRSVRSKREAEGLAPLLLQQRVESAVEHGAAAQARQFETFGIGQREFGAIFLRALKHDRHVEFSQEIQPFARIECAVVCDDAAAKKPRLRHRAIEPIAIADLQRVPHDVGRNCAQARLRVFTGAFVRSVLDGRRRFNRRYRYLCDGVQARPAFALLADQQIARFGGKPLARAIDRASIDAIGDDGARISGRRLVEFRDHAETFEGKQREDRLAGRRKPHVSAFAVLHAEGAQDGRVSRRKRRDFGKRIVAPVAVVVDEDERRALIVRQTIDQITGSPAHLRIRAGAIRSRGRRLPAAAQSAGRSRACPLRRRRAQASLPRAREPAASARRR